MAMNTPNTPAAPTTTPPPPTTTSARFSAEQQQHYVQEGWAFVPALISEAQVRALQKSCAVLLHKAKDLEHDTRVRGVFFEVQSSTGRKRETAIRPGLLRKITGPSKAEPAFAALRTDTGVVDVARGCGLLQPRCVVDQLTLKPARVGTGFPFHQDAAFLHGDARAELKAFGACHVVIALDDADADNGGFEVLGRTHVGNVLADHSDYDTSTRREGLFDESHRELVGLRAGDAVVFDPWLAHGSGPNLSATDRRLVTLWFVGGTVVTGPGA